MLLNSRSGVIEKLDIDKIGDSELTRLHQIQKDAWSFFVGEYVSCLSCDKIFSKKDIYENNEGECGKKSIIELEEEHGCDDIRCKSCGGKTKFLRGEEAKMDMDSRLFDSIDSYIVVLRNRIGEIIGFSYSYIDTFERIFNKELSATFSMDFLKKYDEIRNQVMISIPSTCMEEKNINIVDIFNLFKALSMCVDGKYNDITGVFESIIGSLTYKIFQAMGGKKLDLPNNGKEFYVKDLQKANQVSDIIFHPYIVRDYKALEGMSFKDFLTKLKSF